MQRLVEPLVGPLTAGLTALAGALHSYALAIVVVALLFRLGMTPLQLRQARMARRLRALAPRLSELERQYRDDLTGFARARAAILKQEGISQKPTLALAALQLMLFGALLVAFQNLAGAHTLALFHQHLAWFRLDRPDRLLGIFGPLSGMVGLAQWALQRMAMQPGSDPLTHAVQQLVPLTILVTVLVYPASLAISYLTSTIYQMGVQYAVGGWGQLFVSPFRLAPTIVPAGHPDTAIPLARAARPASPRVADRAGSGPAARTRRRRRRR